MGRWRFTSKESVFLWSSSGVQRVRKRIREAFRSKTSHKTLLREDGAIEHRHYPRLDLRLPILYKVLGDNASQIPPGVRPHLLAESTNISPIGLCLNLAEKLVPGTVVALTFYVLDKREKFSAIGRVVWTRPAGEPEHCLTGLQFVVVEGDSVVREEHSRLETLVRQLEGGG